MMHPRQRTRGICAVYASCHPDQPPDGSGTTVLILRFPSNETPRMSHPVPPSFLFRYRFPVRRNDALPAQTSSSAGGRRRKQESHLLPLADQARLPDILLPGRDPANPFAELRLGWNTSGLGISVVVSGRTRLPRGDLERPAESDGIRFWFDTRNTQSNQRAGRFCHCYAVLPAVGEKAGSPPGVVQLPLPRAREDAPTAETDLILQASEATTQGYRVDTWFPAEVLHGFDPENIPALGF